MIPRFYILFYFNTKLNYWILLRTKLKNFLFNLQNSIYRFMLMYFSKQNLSAIFLILPKINHLTPRKEGKSQWYHTSKKLGKKFECFS